LAPAVLPLDASAENRPDKLARVVVLLTVGSAPTSWRAP
jgi:hypothetical protein